MGRNTSLRAPARSAVRGRDRRHHGRSAGASGVRRGERRHPFCDDGAGRARQGRARVVDGRRRSARTRRRGGDAGSRFGRSAIEVDGVARRRRGDRLAGAHRHPADGRGQRADGGRGSGAGPPRVPGGDGQARRSPTSATVQVDAWPAGHFGQAGEDERRLAARSSLRAAAARRQRVGPPGRRRDRAGRPQQARGAAGRRPRGGADPAGERQLRRRRRRAAARRHRPARDHSAAGRRVHASRAGSCAGSAGRCTSASPPARVWC